MLSEISADALRDISGSIRDETYLTRILFHCDISCIVRRFLILVVGLTTSEGGVYAFKSPSLRATSEALKANH